MTESPQGLDDTATRRDDLHPGRRGRFPYGAAALRGPAVAVGDDYFGQTDIPGLPDGVVHTGVAAGAYNTVLLSAAQVVVQR